MRDKLGLLQPLAGDDALAQELLDCMTLQHADFTLTFRRLADWAVNSGGAATVRSLFADPLPFDAWSARWRERLAAEGRDPAVVRAGMRACNPAVIPRNHRIEEVIQAAQRNDDFEPFERLLTVLSMPYEDRPEFAHYATPPQPHEVIQATFCGT
jgi:uncharacterized protein YdiU (UPF0061 family)